MKKRSKLLTDKLKEIPVEKVKAELINVDNGEQTITRFIEQKAKLVQAGKATYKDIGNELNLTPEQIIFCEMLVSSDTSGNATECYAISHDLDLSDIGERKRANAGGVRLTKANHPCVTLINIILSGLGFNQTTMDRQLLYLALQKSDLRASAMAIGEYNKLSGRTTKRTIEVIHTPRFDWDSLNRKELKNLIETAKKALINPLDNDDQPD